ncbi:MAG TPA: hypothetical protein VLQ45_09520, partial [Thermoanaerobaculia bacterium]|nr:hypothetical protein [Thermoanaerobaculia bacterium]
LGAASAYYLANLDASQVPALWEVVRRHSLERTATALARRDRLRGEEGENVLRFHFAYEAAVLDSIAPFAEVPPAVRQEAAGFLDGLKKLAGAGAASPAATATPEEGIVYRRSPEPKGPMGGFGYDYFQDKTAEKGVPAPALLGRDPLWGEASYAYEALNFVDGRRTVRQIRDDLAAIYGPVPVSEVAEYLAALEKIGVLARPAR